MKRIDLWKLLLVLPLTFTLSTPVFAEDVPAAPEARETATAAEEASESSDDDEAKEKEEYFALTFSYQVCHAVFVIGMVVSAFGASAMAGYSSLLELDDSSFT